MELFKIKFKYKFKYKIRKFQYLNTSAGILTNNPLQTACIMKRAMLFFMTANSNIPLPSD